MSTIIKNTRKIFINTSGGGSGDPGLTTRVETLENNELKITYFENINASSGTITIPTGATILLDQFQSGADAFVSTISNGQPTGYFPETSGELTVDVSSFDALGNYTLTGTPNSYPVALIYILKIKSKDYVNLIVTNIITTEDFNALYKYNQSIAGNYSGTSIAKASSQVLFNGETNNLTQVIAGTPIINIIGNTSTNIGTRLDATGLRIGQLSGLHNSNSYVFNVTSGVSLFGGQVKTLDNIFIGGTGSPSAWLVIAGATTTQAQLRLLSASTPSAPNDGDIWYDGTDLKMRVGATTKTFTLI